MISCLPMTMSSTSSRCASIFGENASLNCPETFSSDIPIISPGGFRLHANCSISCLVLSNFMVCQYMHFSLRVCPKEWNHVMDFSCKLAISGMLFMIGSNLFHAIFVSIKADMFFELIKCSNATLSCLKHHIFF